MTCPSYDRPVSVVFVRYDLMVKRWPTQDSKYRASDGIRHWTVRLVREAVNKIAAPKNEAVDMHLTLDYDVQML
jgi:hypothetical protein